MKLSPLYILMKRYHIAIIAILLSKNEITLAIDLAIQYK